MLALVCAQRGLMPLHASCLRSPHDGSAFAICAPSGTGKSTLAAVLARRGWGLLADDVGLLDFDDAGTPWVRSAIPRLKLWETSLEALGLDRGDLSPIFPGIEKFSVPTAFDPAPAPLKAVFCLGDDALAPGSNGLPAWPRFRL